MKSTVVLIIAITLVLESCVYHDLDKSVNCATSNLKLTLDSVTTATSCIAGDGKIYVTAIGGEEPYQFSVNGRPEQSENIFTGLNSGIYSISVHDKNGCAASLNNIAITAAGFQFSTTVQSDTECLNHNGTILIDIQEGTPPYLYKINNGDFSENNLFSGLSSGQYTVEVKNAEPCTVRFAIVIPRGNTGVSWTNDILPIMKISCATNGCHDGKSRSDYRVYANVKKEAPRTKSFTQDGSMPFNEPPLPKNQIDQIACWVDDGAADN